MASTLSLSGKFVLGEKGQCSTYVTTPVHIGKDTSQWQLITKTNIKCLDDPETGFCHFPVSRLTKLYSNDFWKNGL